MIGADAGVRGLALAAATITITLLGLWVTGGRISVRLAQAAEQQRASSAPLPDTFGFGRPATPDAIAELDIDVMPDGTGLPPGSGTVAQGARTWGRFCRGCHGPEGEGGTAAPLVGRDPSGRPLTVGNFWPYATTLYDYINRAMPRTAPGTLTPDQRLWARGLDPGQERDHRRRRGDERRDRTGGRHAGPGQVRPG